MDQIAQAGSGSIARPVQSLGKPAIRAGVGRGWRRRLLIGGLGLIVLAMLVGLTSPVRRLKSLFGGSSDQAAIFVVKPTTLNITLREDGELKPVESVEIKCEVQGERVTIEWVIPESTRVSKGDLLLKLAAEDMKDRVDTAELELKGIAAALEEAQQALLITRSENQSRIAKAEVDLEVANLELEGYLEGDYQRALKTIQIAIMQTNTELARKQEELEKSRPLEARGFITKARIKELEDEVERLKLTLEKNQLELRTLDEIEFKKNRMQKVAAVEQARQELERERQRAESREKQALAKVEDQQQALAIRQRRFERLKEQLGKCEIRSPVDGIVQYGDLSERRYWGGNRVAVGEQAYPGQTLLTIPDTSKMMVSTRIHEADRHKLREGLPCLVRVPAVPGRTFTGTLTKIAKFADSERSWLNPNLKEHASEIRLDESDAPLSPGDTAHIEILIEEVPDVLAVPVQAVFTRGAQHFVFVRKGVSVEPVEIRLGRTTATMVEVTAGLNAGDKVLMAPEERHLAMLPAPAASQPAPPPAPAPAARGAPPRG